MAGAGGLFFHAYISASPSRPLCTKVTSVAWPATEVALAVGRAHAMVIVMRTDRPFGPTCAMALILVLAGPLGAQYAPMPQPPAPAPAAPSVAVPKGKDESKSALPAAKIEGVVIARADGRWLGLALEGNNFKLHFYDKDKKTVKPDAARASVRWNPVGKTGELRTVLNPAGDTLVSPLFVAPPLTFRVFLTLLSAEDQVLETYIVEMRGP